MTKVYCDSSLKAACFVVEGQKAVVCWRTASTVNIGEYDAVIRALEEAQRLKLKQVELFTDSELVVRQVSGEYQCKALHLRPSRDYVRELLQELGATLQWIPREENLAGWALG